MTDCPECKHFIYCDWYKIVYSKATDCKEFEERIKNNENQNQT